MPMSTCSMRSSGSTEPARRQIYFGVPDQAMRIWMNPDRMASLGITTTDIQNAVSRQNALYGAGQIGQQPNAGNVQLTFPVVTQPPFIQPCAV